MGIAAYASIRTGVELELVAVPAPPPQQHTTRPLAQSVACAGDSLPSAAAVQQPTRQIPIAELPPSALASLSAAIAQLESLSKADLVELKSFKAPPEVVKLVMEAVCVLMGRAPTWENSHKLLKHAPFLHSLKAFDKDAVSSAQLCKLRKYVGMPELHPDAVSKVSKAAQGLWVWVLGIAAYASIRTGVELELVAAPAAPPPRPPARPKSAPMSVRTRARPPWDDGRPKKPQPSAALQPPPTQAQVAWAAPPAAAGADTLGDTNATTASDAASTRRLSNVLGSVQHIAEQLDVLSRVVADIDARLGVVEQLL